MFGDSLALWNGFRLACGSVVMVEAQAAVEVGAIRRWKHVSGGGMVDPVWGASDLVCVSFFPLALFQYVCG